ncbi:MAG: hypothetical protein QOG80_3104 [Pseudonocardiales bacterium]|nr:hypothetical protein [Pseudonocardiales bacterium]
MKSQHKWLAAGAATALVVLVWPGPAVHADTSLGGYTGIATAAAVHLEIFDPTIPIPAEPQGDGSVGYTKSNVDSGPTSRALSSYLWPGVVIGDGFDQITKSPGSVYPLQVDSRYPATAQAPPTNAIQLTDSNGMQTSTDGFTTKASITLLGLAGDGSNPLGGLGSGLPQLGGVKPSPAPTGKSKPAPLDVGNSIAALVSAKNVSSTSTVTVADKTVTSEAHASVSSLSLLGGIISVSGLDVVSKVVSDGAKATTSETTSLVTLKVLGIPVPITDSGINLGLPALSSILSGLLKTLGIQIRVMPVEQTVEGASGSVSTRALQLSIDTKPLKAVVDNVLNPILAMIPQAAKDQLAPILGLGPRIVLTLGTTDTSASAAPAYNPGSFPGGAIGGNSTGTGVGNTSTGNGNTGNGLLPASQPTATSPGGTTPLPASQPAAYSLPGLGSVPRGLIIGGIVLAAAIGWALRRGGGMLLGGGRNCDFGLTTGVPDLRKG